jgi:maleate cis-trans isomerase
MMAVTQKEYVVGLVYPTNRPEGKETQLDEKLPPSIQLVGLTLNFTRGNEEEFGASMSRYEVKVAELTAKNASLIIPAGAPPFMLLGFQGEREMIRRWEQKYGVPMFTSGQNHVRALRTLEINAFVGVSYFPEKLNAVFARYFTEAGFHVLAMDGIPVQFAAAPKLPAQQIAEFVKKLFEKHPNAQGVYMLGSAWKTLDMVEPLEQALGVAVVHPGPARHWETLVRLGFCKGLSGYGKLLAEMPAAAPPV